MISGDPLREEVVTVLSRSKCFPSYLGSQAIVIINCSEIYGRRLRHNGREEFYKIIQIN